AELHPVYAMAMRVKQNQNEDVWAIYARNWGNEGYCSSKNHRLLLTRITLRLPMPYAAAAQIDGPATKFVRNNPQVAWGSAFEPSEHAQYVTLVLGGPENKPLIDGELHLRWTAASPQPVTAVPNFRIPANPPPGTAASPQPVTAVPNFRIPANPTPVVEQPEG